MCIGEESLTISDLWPRKDQIPDLYLRENKLFWGSHNAAAQYSFAHSQIENMFAVVVGEIEF